MSTFPHVSRVSARAVECGWTVEIHERVRNLVTLSKGNKTIGIYTDDAGDIRTVVYQVRPSVVAIPDPEVLQILIEETHA